MAVRSFDADGNVEQVDSAGLKTYALDDAFRITGITDTVDSSLSWSYGYDALDRLTSASKTGQSQTWTYDANGNRLTQGGTTSSTFTISSSNNRLSSVSGGLSRTYSYDSSGNTTGYSGLTFTYNDAGRLTGVSGSASASYSHNAFGQRVKKTVGSTSTYFVYDEAGHLVGEYDGSGTLIQEIVWFGDTPVASLRNVGGSLAIFYIHADHLNTPRRITRPSDNAILWRWDSDPFGTDAANEDADGNTVAFAFNLRFPGQYLDAETGLSYNYFRDYDPAIGRYVESDPVGLDAGVGTYTYVGNGPNTHSDRYGLFTYNKPPPDTVPVPLPMFLKVTCLETCFGTPLVVTGGMEKFTPSGKLYHSRNTLHYAGNAVDFGFNSNPSIPARKADFFCCAFLCGLNFGRVEGPPRFQPQVHLQDIPGNGISQQNTQSTCSCKR